MGASYSGNRAIYCLSQSYPEVTLYLSPSDLISLSRSCLLFWKALSNSGFVWRRALENNPTIPPCPVDRRHLTWVLLYSTNECSVCGTPTENPIYTPLKVRLCSSCERKELVASPWGAPNGYTHWHRGVHRFDQVVLRRDLERWISRGGKVELCDPSPKCVATMYPAHPVADNWLHPQVVHMRVLAERGLLPPPPSPRQPPPTFFSQKASDAWLRSDVQQMRLDAQLQAAGAEQPAVGANPIVPPAGLTRANVEEHARLDAVNGPPSSSSSDAASTSGSSACL